MLFAVLVPGFVKGVEGDGGAVGGAVAGEEEDEVVGVEELVEDVDLFACGGEEAGGDLGQAGFVVAGDDGERGGSVGVEDGWCGGVGGRIGDEGEEEALLFLGPGREMKQDRAGPGAFEGQRDGEGDVLVVVGAVGRVIGGAAEDVCGEGALGSVAVGLPADVVFAVGGHAVDGGGGGLRGEQLSLGGGGEGQERQEDGKKKREACAGVHGSQYSAGALTLALSIA